MTRATVPGARERAARPGAPGRRRWRSWVAVLAVTLVAVELLGRLIFSWDALFFLVAADNSPSWRQIWLLEHRDTGEIASGTGRYAPDRGWVNRPLLRDHPTGDEGKRLSTNSRGLRGSREFAAEPAPGGIRLLAVGDSFTFGEEVADDETFCARLAALLPGVEVINFGVAGYGHDQMLIHLQKEGMSYRPDVVLIGFIVQDIGRNLLSFRSYAKPYFVLGPGGLRLRGTPVPSPDEVRRGWPWRPRSLDLLEMLLQPVRRWATARSLTWVILDEMVAVARAGGALPMLADLPSGAQLVGDAWKFRLVEEFATARRLPYSLLRPHVQQRMAAGESFVTGLRHWNAEGHRWVAEELREALLAQGVLDCGPVGAVRPCRAGPALASWRAP